MPSATPSSLRLGEPGLSWEDLHTPTGLATLLARFEACLAARDGEGLSSLRAARRDPDALSEADVSALVVRLAPHVGAFLARLFGVEREVEATRRRTLSHEPVFLFRKRFVKQRLFKGGAGAAAVGEDEARALATAAWRAAGVPVDEPPEMDEERYVAIATLRLLELHETARKVARAGGGGLDGRPPRAPRRGPGGARGARGRRRRGLHRARDLRRRGVPARPLAHPG